MNDDDNPNFQVKLVQDHRIQPINRSSSLGVLQSSSRKNSHIDSRLLETLNSAIAKEKHGFVCCEKLTKWWNLLKGYILTIVFALCSCISSILVKKSFTLSGSDSAVIRYLIQFVTMLIIAKYKNLNPFGIKEQRKLLTYRGLAGITSLLCGFFAIKFINPSDFKAINHSSIIITAILARLFLKEKLTIAHVLALILTIIGVLLISQPSFIKSIIYKNNNFSNSTTNSSAFESMLDIKNSKKEFYLLVGVIFSLCAAFGGGRYV